MICYFSQCFNKFITIIDLNFTTILAKSIQFQPSAFIYLNFDDGPNIGTNFVLDVLKAEEVRATFFINSINHFDPTPEFAERNIQRF